jgi:hypothetical protein
VGLVLAEIWGLRLMLFGVPILLFPDGRLSSRFWRGTLRVYGVLFGALLIVTGVAVAGALAQHPSRVDSTGGLAAVDHPAGWFNVVQGPLVLAVIGLSLAFIIRQVLSWRRSAGERRQQLKWLASGGAVSIVCLFLGGTFSTAGPSKTLLGVIGSLAWLGVAALPVSMGVAILKYRLYDIDRIISRTLAYTIVTGLLVGVYAGLVLLGPPRCSASIPRSRWLPPRWLRRPCSTRSGGGCSTGWTGGSTGPGTTRTRPWRRSRPG